VSLDGEGGAREGRAVRYVRAPMDHPRSKGLEPQGEVTLGSLAEQARDGAHGLVETCRSSKEA
jgi:hypothetical protein